MFNKKVKIETFKSYHQTELPVESSSKTFSANSTSKIFEEINLWLQSVKTTTPISSSIHIYTLGYDHILDVTIGAMVTCISSDSKRSTVNTTMYLDYKCVVDGVDYKLFTDFDSWKDDERMVDRISRVIPTQLPHILSLNTKQLKNEYNIR